MNELEMLRRQNEMQTESQGSLQEQSFEGQSRLVAPQLREQLAEAQAAVIAQTNPAKALRIILDGFRGKMEEDSGDTIQVGSSLMNEKGIGKIASMLIPFINDPIRFGHIKGAEVRDLALQIANDITKELGLNWREYGILDASTRDIILDALITLIFITLTRSEEGGEKRFLSRVVVESIGSAQKKKKEGALKELFKW